ncbi:MAG: hypothetical protein F4Z18_14625 [Caldilineaceae bacterium SB0666_bin_21]|nr:hypothetical protein [Caldilineaceae bacterium SB0666_bin_21]
MSDTTAPGRFWQLDRFTIGLLVLIGTLFLVALVSVVANRDQTDIEPLPLYRTDNSPEAVVYNGYLALQRGEMDQYEKLFAPERWEELNEKDGDILFGYYSPDTFRLKVVDAAVDDSAAVVTVAVYHTDDRGIFGFRSVQATQWTIDVELVDGQWKLLNRLPQG